VISKSKLNIKIVIVAISFCQGLQFAISPILQKIQLGYPDIPVKFIQMLITMPSLMAVVVAVISGWLVTRISKKTLIIVGALICGISGLIPLIHPSFQLLFIARIFLGVGLGIMTTLSTAVIADHFEGIERVKAMGIQGASVGAAMLIITVSAGYLGKSNHEWAYLLHIWAIIAFFVIGKCLPNTGKELNEGSTKIRLNKKVYAVSVLAMVEFIFLISFSTNIAMHISGELKGNTLIAGTIIGVFSGVQIVFGLILGHISKYTKQYTLHVAMFSFSIGAIILVSFPDNYMMLIIGALFCGASQGIFIPRAMFEITNAVNAISAAMAAATITATMNFGQFVSPIILNDISNLVFGELTTANIFLIGAIIMSALPVLLFFLSKGAKNNEVLDRY